MVSFSDYSPYGVMLDNRHGEAAGVNYRYGFQGQEADDEIKGEGNSYNYTYRMHDPRLGRFFAVDPLASKYPWYTPYQFSGNRPIDCVELEGLEPEEAGKSIGSRGVAQIGDEWHKFIWTQVSTTETNWVDKGTYFTDWNKKQIHVPNDATELNYKYQPEQTIIISNGYKNPNNPITYKIPGYYYVSSFKINGDTYTFHKSDGTFWSTRGGKFSNIVDDNGYYKGNIYETKATNIFHDVPNIRLNSAWSLEYFKDIGIDLTESLFLDKFLKIPNSSPKDFTTILDVVEMTPYGDNHKEKVVCMYLMMQGPGAAAVLPAGRYEYLKEDSFVYDKENIGKTMIRTIIFHGYNGNGQPVFTDNTTFERISYANEQH